MENKTTIYDIAKRLNITAATVSRALNNNPRISKNTRKLVLETAKEMNYEPNRLAVALKNGKSNMVGVVVPYIDRKFFSTVIGGIESELYPEGYNIIIAQTHDEEKREIEIIRNLLKSQVAGIIISVARFTKETKHFQEAIKSDVPVVFFDRRINVNKSSSVMIDDYQGSYEATKHLIEQGRKRIGHLTVDLSLEIYTNRYNGYKDAIIDSGIEFDENLVVQLRSDIEEGKRAAEKLMSLNNPPDAILSTSDYGALGAINWLRSKGYSIPEDVAVVGFSNEPFTQFMELPISSIDQKPLDMGRTAAKLFLKKAIKGNAKAKDENIVLQPELLVRASSQAHQTLTN